MNLYCALELSKIRDIENDQALDIESGKKYLEMYSNFSAHRKETYPGKDILYFNKDRACESVSWPALLITVDIDEDELQNVLNLDVEKDYHYFSKYTVSIIK